MFVAEHSWLWSRVSSEGWKCVEQTLPWFSSTIGSEGEEMDWVELVKIVVSSSSRFGETLTETKVGIFSGALSSQHVLRTLSIERHVIISVFFVFVAFVRGEIYSELWDVVRCMSLNLNSRVGNIHALGVDSKSLFGWGFLLEFGWNSELRVWLKLGWTLLTWLRVSCLFVRFVECGRVDCGFGIKLCADRSWGLNYAFA